MEPTIRVRQRSAVVHAAALESNYTPLQANLLAGRLADHQAVDLHSHVRPQMADLDSPDSLPDIDKAVERICRAIKGREDVILCVDHDADGVTSIACLRGALIDIFGHPAERTHNFISHRMKEGYGISDGVVDRIAKAGHRSGVLISGDQGSSDQPRIKRLLDMGVDTVVTDHHGVEGKGPESAYACVNPVREDSRYPDKSIAGCMVAWLTMAAVRRELIDCGHLHKDTPHLSDYLPAVALGTTADCVSFATSRNNRIVVQRGLHLINRNPAPCWEALREIRQVHGPITSATLAYIFAAMVNAAGRLDEAMTGVKLLRSVTIEQARGYAAELLEANEERKQISAEMLVVAMDQATRMVAEGAVGLSIWLPNGHSGVHGISASRVTEAYGRPAVCISPKLGQKGVVTGSARSIPGFHVRDAFSYIKERMPDPADILASGGHAMAGGITLNESAIPAFRELWNESVLASGVVIGPVIHTDGELPVAPSFSLLAEVSALEPFGKDFEAPLFSQRSVVRSARAVGDGGKHVKLSLEVQGRVIDGIWFNTPELSWRLEPGVPVNAVFELGSNTYRGNTTMQALVRHLALRC